MKEPVIPTNENERIKSLESYQILDTLPEEVYDNITKIATQICSTPIALISLIDPQRQWFKSRQGLDAQETPRKYAFCAHAINKPNELLIINDATKDERFFDNPLTVDDPNVIFYAGAPLTSSDGYALGTLCVIDNKPRTLSKEQQVTLIALAAQVASQFELRKKNIQLTKEQEKLKETNKQLEQFSYIIAHDVNAPLRGISTLVDFIKEDHAKDLNDEVRAKFDLIQNRTKRVQELLISILQYSKAGKKTTRIETFNVLKVIEEIRFLVQIPTEIKLNVDKDLPNIRGSFIQLQQVLSNLIGNAIKYHDKPKGKIDLKIEVENANFLKIRVRDDGPGIKEKFHKKIFSVFETANENSRTESSGIGLSIVKKLVQINGGTIGVSSEFGQGSEFWFTWPIVRER